MKLTHARIRNFRSILDTGKFSISDLCCLVGKNEAGKTATLSAIQSIRPYGEAQTAFDVTEDYPRRFATRYKERHPHSEATVVETWWQMSDKAHALLVDAFGEDAVKSREFTISKRYNTENTTWNFNLDEAAAVKNIVDTFKFNATEKAPLAKANSVAAVLTALNELAERTEKQENLHKHLSGFRNGSIQCKAIDLTNKLVPTFFYTSHYDRMSGQLSIQQLAKDKAANTVDPADEIFLDFLRLAGTSLEELNDAPRFEELNAKCEAASADITDQIFKYWSQNDNLEVEVKLGEGRPEDPAPFNAGPVARARVYNRLHRASVSFSERSAGFVWFFSFLVQFAMMRRDTNNVIILLDEPGLTLHGKAQADLLRYIEEELLPAHQVIFSTHSPFMVPPKRLADCRVVEDVIIYDEKHRPSSEGTRITEDVMSTDKDTIFPLQGALGYEITQSLFVGENTLLVEGTSDILYLQALSNELEIRGRAALDPRWTMCPAGGIDNIKPFVSLFAGNHLNVAVLSDQAQNEKAKIERIRKSQVLAAGRLHTIAELLEKQEADIEDLIAPGLFCAIVNGCYNLDGEHSLDPKKLEESDTTERQVKKAEAYFNLLPDDIPTFSHFRPADWLIKNSGILSVDSEEVSKTLDRAEKVIAIYNEMLV